LLLTAAEEGDLRATLAKSGIGFGHRRPTGRGDRTPPYDELVIPVGVAALHDRKPGATLRALLRAVADGRPQEAALAAGCVAGLVKSPRVGAMYAMIADDQLDAPRDGVETRRRQMVRVLGKMVSDRETEGGRAK
jgi:hypothetical protein